jgi:hypothetical protein
MQEETMQDSEMHRKLDKILELLGYEDPKHPDYCKAARMVGHLWEPVHTYNFRGWVCSKCGKTEPWKEVVGI